MHLVLLLVCLSLAACHAGAQGAGSADGKRPRVTSLQLIAEARERGDLDDDRATLYRVYAVMDGAKLPTQYRGSAPQKDGTTVLRDAKARFPTLRPETRDLLRPYLFPKGER